MPRTRRSCTKPGLLLLGGGRLEWPDRAILNKHMHRWSSFVIVLRRWFHASTVGPLKARQHRLPESLSAFNGNAVTAWTPVDKPA